MAVKFFTCRRCGEGTTVYIISQDEGFRYYHSDVRYTGDELCLRCKTESCDDNSSDNVASSAIVPSEVLDEIAKANALVSTMRKGLKGKAGVMQLKDCVKLGCAHSDGCLDSCAYSDRCVHSEKAWKGELMPCEDFFKVGG